MAACDDTAGWTFEAVVTGGTVEAVEITGVDDACAGGSLSLTVTDESGSVIGDGSMSVPAGGTVTVAIDEAPAAAGATDVHVLIAGP